MRFAGLVKTAALGALLGAMLAFPLQAAGSALDALTAFALSVLPALLPFTVCARLLTAGRRLPPGCIAALGMLGGSPAGARLLGGAGLQKESACRYAALTGGFSPMFYLSTLALWLGNAGEARLLLLCNLAAAALAGLCFPRGKGKVCLPPVAVTRAISEGAQAMLTVAACMALGGVSARMLALALPLPPLANAVLYALLEASGGAKELIALGAPLPLTAALLGFGGGSLLLQNAAGWRGLGLSDLTKTALLRAVLSGALCATLHYIFHAVTLGVA